MAAEQTDFYGGRRERFLNEKPYADLVRSRESSVAEARSWLAEDLNDADDDAFRRWNWDIATSQVELLVGAYSAGVNLSVLPARFETALYPIELTALPHPRYRTEPFYLDELDTYAYAMWLLSLCKLLRLDPLLPRVMALFDVARDDNRGKDALYEALVAKLGGEPVPVEPAGTMLKIVKAHPLLLQAIEAEPRKRPLLVAEFLKKWYPSMKNTYWYNRHDKVPQNFFGYWAFEAGLVTYLWDIDDKGYRDLPFYPKDLVDYARAHPEINPLALSAAPATEARPPSTPAPHPCPREGWWMTPAKADSRRYFRQGEEMPDLKSDYGSTIWQWDDKQT